MADNTKNVSAKKSEESNDNKIILIVVIIVALMALSAIILSIIALILSAKTTDGKTGPTGATGDTGAVGPTGPSGIIVVDQSGGNFTGFTGIDLPQLDLGKLWNVIVPTINGMSYNIDVKNLDYYYIQNNLFPGSIIVNIQNINNTIGSTFIINYRSDYSGSQLPPGTQYFSLSLPSGYTYREYPLNNVLRGLNTPINTILSAGTNNLSNSQVSIQFTVVNSNLIYYTYM